ncbi:polysaccharide deacetylase family protein [Novosphingobium aquimarinum]|uniref:polysaccharide deacetylase family protein n=1 Tax=Novosphingobium aquimarinum TaxID=2682494 RepID=UPI0018DC5C76|nr:polysaccharide deacetylase family protein [Novosphingobium aquimarinum]
MEKLVEPGQTIDRKRERKLRFACGMALALAAMAVLLAGEIAPLWGKVLLATALLFAAHRAMTGTPGVAVLTYHSVTDAPSWLPWSGEITVHPRSFAAQLAMLRRMNLRTIGDEDMADLRARGQVPAKDCVVIHFDDGYLDNLAFAAPMTRAAGFSATIFPSLDFIEPEDSPRQNDDSAGYLRWSELRRLRDEFCWRVESHGIDHSRIPTSERAVDVVTRENWRRHAWLQWRAMPGAKHDWFRSDAPPAVPIGSPVPESALALAACGWTDGRREDESDLRLRLHHHLATSRQRVAQEMGRPAAIFCWPENRACPAGREIAWQTGYVATTAGKGRNTANESPSVISRLHVGDRALGFRWPWADAQLLRAQIRLMQGNFYWYPIVAAMNATRKAVFAWRKWQRRSHP